MYVWRGNLLDVVSGFTCNYHLLGMLFDWALVVLGFRAGPGVDGGVCVECMRQHWTSYVDFVGGFQSVFMGGDTLS